jgi:hypothetical protein
MRATGWMRRSRLAAAGVTAVTVVGLTASPAVGSQPAPRPATLAKSHQKTGVVPGTVIAVLAGPSVTGSRLGGGRRAPRTSSPAVNTALEKLGATSILPLFAKIPSSTAQALTRAARQRMGSSALSLGDVVLIHVTARSRRPRRWRPRAASRSPSRTGTCRR